MIKGKLKDQGVKTGGTLDLEKSLHRLRKQQKEEPEYQVYYLQQVIKGKLKDQGVKTGGTLDLEKSLHRLRKQQKEEPEYQVYYLQQVIKGKLKDQGVKTGGTLDFLWRRPKAAFKKRQNNSKKMESNVVIELCKEMYHRNVLQRDNFSGNESIRNRKKFANFAEDVAYLTQSNQITKVLDDESVQEAAEKAVIVEMRELTKPPKGPISGNRKRKGSSEPLFWSDDGRAHKRLKRAQENVLSCPDDYVPTQTGTEKLHMLRRRLRRKFRRSPRFNKGNVK